jgi:phage shock protein E
MKKIIFFLLAAGMAMGSASPSFSADGDKPLIIDVRTDAEWNEGHVEGAILIPYELIGDRIGRVAKDKSMRIYVYCRSGRRSQIAKETLEKLRYTNVVNLGPLESAAKKTNNRIIR